MKARLSVIEGKARVTTLELGGQRTYTVGRRSRNDLSIRDRNVSREHCRIEHDGEFFWLVDNDSANGTFVNGEKVQRYMLQDGDMLKVGPCTVVFQIVEHDEKQH